MPGSAASPTVATESILITGVIDAKEKRDVATLDLPGAFISADQDIILHMVLRGKLAKLLVMAAPEIYTKFVWIGKDGKIMLYVKLLKALYGCLCSALLFYRKRVKYLKAMGFVLNPYEPYMANRMVEGTQQTKPYVGMLMILNYPTSFIR